MDALAIEALRAALLVIEDQPDEKRFYEALLRWSLHTTGAEEGGVLSVAENRNTMRIESWVGKGVELKSRILPLKGYPPSICARCVQSAKPILISDVRSDASFLAKSDSPIRSQLTVPVCHRGKVIGLLNLESTRPDYFTQEHKDTMLRFANEAGPFWKLATISLREHRLEELLKSLQRVSESLLKENPEKTLEMLLDEALRLTDSVLGGVCLLSTDKDVLVVHPAKGLKAAITGKPQIPRGSGFTWLSITEGTKGKSQNIPDVREHPDLYHDLSEGQIRSLLCVPMFEGLEPVGVLNMESNELNHFSLLDEEMLLTFAYQAAIAVKMLSHRERFAAADALAALGSLSGNLTHTINNTVGGIRVLSKMLARKLEMTSPELHGMAEEIHTAATQTLGVVEHYEEMFSLEEKLADTSNLIKSVVAEIHTPPGITVKVNLCKPNPIVLVSQNAFCEIVRELVRNAVKALGNTGCIVVQTWQNDFHVFVSVSDDGCPIPEERAAQLFEKGHSVRSNAVGAGFGLWWIKTYMCKLSG
ncbi:MAG: GAF domain-containing sensor histidine kinase [Verrucomicrobiota bacterium]|jgi:putative methionine-R-sulfoxide reductase with GAF domain